MHTGIVNRFNKIKGYGFITPDQGSDELFVHFSSVKTEGYKVLIPGQKVSYQVGQGERGLFATEVYLNEEAV